ncbi:hypothetical protein ABZ519_28455 [Streptomyces collinus]|uniref:hypothetical protein n=1 Tax=Streptomyces collinus TaxID=42684 RepID=UPI003411913D
MYCPASRDARTRLLDAARFAENAWLVTRHEAACRDMTGRQVAPSGRHPAGRTA